MDEALLALADDQHGLLTRSQFDEAGKLGVLRQRLHTGEWVVEQPGVVRPATTKPDLALRFAAVALRLGCDGDTSWVFSHRSAAHLHGFPLPEPELVDVLLAVSNRAARLLGARRHLSRVSPKRHWRSGHPVSPIPETVVQCARGLPRADLVHVVEYVIREGLSTFERLRNVCGRGVEGSTALRDVLDELSAEGIDKWMRRLVRALEATELPVPELEVPFEDEDGHVRALIDGLFRAAGLALEMDDWETHGSRQAQERDRERDRWLLRQHGITTVRMTPRQLRNDPEKVVSDIVGTYERLMGLRVA